MNRYFNKCEIKITFIYRQKELIRKEVKQKIQGCKIQWSLILKQVKKRKFMNRNNKPKKQSKLKHTIINEHLAYNSPAKFSTITALSSGCCPKQPPNISKHHLEKKRNEIKGQYYNMGKENKYRVINNGFLQKEGISIVETVDRLREKRNTHHLISYEATHTKLLEPKKSAQFICSNQVSNSSKATIIKSLNKSKIQIREPIPLGKSKQIRLGDKQSRLQRNERILRKQIRQRSSYAPQVQECNLRCFQNLSSHSIAQSKASTNYLVEMNSMDDSSFKVEKHVIEKQREVQSKKKLHRSPKIMSPTSIIQLPDKTPTEQIAEFEAKINEINTNFQHDSLAYMQTKDFEYVQSKNLNCYLGNQIYLDWKKRATVIDWMIEVLTEIGGKRQTLANAVNIFDRYLSMTVNVGLQHVQCIAAASLLIAGKLQDKSLSASYLSLTTQQKYSAEQIMQEEYRVFETLGFRVNTPTLNSWANRLAVQWDIYLDSMDLTQYDVITNNIGSIKFKNSDEISYYNYRWLCQYIDFSIMDIYTLRYQPRMLSLAFIYLILVMRLDLNTKEKVISLFPNSSQFLLEKTVFHQFFSNFLKDSFNQELMDLLPMIQYCSTFVILPLRFDLPQAVPETNLENEEEEVNYELFCSYQTKNQNTLPSLYNRNRSVY